MKTIKASRRSMALWLVLDFMTRAYDEGKYLKGQCIWFKHWSPMMKKRDAA